MITCEQLKYYGILARFPRSPPQRKDPFFILLTRDSQVDRAKIDSFVGKITC